MTNRFVFSIPFDLADDELTLVSAGHFVGDESTQYAPCYRFEMRNLDSGQVMGRISLLVSNAESIVNGAGHSGFSVLPEFRGKRYAARSIKLIVFLARYHGMRELIFACKADNVPCRRTCELAGATLVDAASQKRYRYRLDLESQKA